MATQWAIAIGINTYRAFQSLQYAQQDAEALCRHLIDSGITAPEHCLLLTPASALHQGHSTFPERATIAQWLKALVTTALGPDDSLWVFFSGYGVHADGEDYLMVVDSDPAQPQATGIALKSIYGLLAQVPSGRVLVTLDMNRNAGSQPEPAGAYTAQLAAQYNRQFPGLATLLSCQPPEEFSRESAGLRQGFFTASLLEVLHSSQRQQPGGSRSLQAIAPELGDRLAELCALYWRPKQTPVVIGDYVLPLGEVAATTLVQAGGIQAGGIQAGNGQAEVQAIALGAEALGGSNGSSMDNGSGGAAVLSPGVGASAVGASRGGSPWSGQHAPGLQPPRRCQPGLWR